MTAKRRSALFAAWTLGALSLGARVVHAQDGVTSSEVVERNGVRMQDFNFLDEIVQCTLGRPEDWVSAPRLRLRTVSLIRMRQNLVPELLRDVETM